MSIITGLNAGGGYATIHVGIPQRLLDVVMRHPERVSEAGFGMRNTTLWKKP